MKRKTKQKKKKRQQQQKKKKKKKLKKKRGREFPAGTGASAAFDASNAGRRAAGARSHRKDRPGDTPPPATAKKKLGLLTQFSPLFSF